MRWLVRSAAAASASAETPTMTSVWTIARIASRRVTVNDTRAGVTGERRAAAAWAAWQACMRTSWVAVIQAHISWQTWCGVAERRMGPREGPPPVIADLSSPIFVSTAPQRCG